MNIVASITASMKVNCCKKLIPIIKTHTLICLIIYLRLLQWGTLTSLSKFLINKLSDRGSGYLRISRRGCILKSTNLYKMAE
jgi:hypothetical protein